MRCQRRETPHSGQRGSVKSPGLGFTFWSPVFAAAAPTPWDLPGGESQAPGSPDPFVDGSLPRKTPGLMTLPKLPPAFFQSSASYLLFSHSFVYRPVLRMRQSSPQDGGGSVPHHCPIDVDKALQSGLFPLACFLRRLRVL